MSEKPLTLTVQGTGAVLDENGKPAPLVISNTSYDIREGQVVYINGMATIIDRIEPPPRLELSAEQIAAARKSNVVSIEQEDDDDGPVRFTGTLDEVIDSLLALKASIPEEYRGSARCTIDSQSGYDSHYPTITVTYDRPETDDEVIDRLSRKAVDEARHERHERAQLAALRAKYERGFD